MMITDDGVVIRFDVSEIRNIGRSTGGVKLMRLADGVKVVSTTICEHEDGAEAPENIENTESGENNEVSEETEE